MLVVVNEIMNVDVDIWRAFNAVGLMRARLFNQSINSPIHTAIYRFFPLLLLSADRFIRDQLFPKPPDRHTMPCHAIPPINQPTNGTGKREIVKQK